MVKHITIEKGTLFHILITTLLVVYSLMSYVVIGEMTVMNHKIGYLSKFLAYALFCLTAIFILIFPLKVFNMIGAEIALLTTGAICIFLTVFSFLSITKPNFLYDKNLHLRSTNKDYPRYGKSGLSISLSAELKGILEKLMANEKPYLNQDLCLDQLAEKMHISRHHTSQIINEHYEMGFHDFINSYRIREAERLLQNDNSSVKEIAFQSGFNSRATFYVAFKKFNGNSPIVYKRKKLAQRPVAVA
ncbi:helix-turn-helix domain-containing protein [Flagellimonas meishanensis]|uniref:helix-turn-helix domain-containing protein n=1 Tax=Flagellimonas meishanensis TaxID=2873264 RepID=UPI001CA7573C|nr:AraC family transcriptional regulator [[Muricauda] meishanensis]